MSLQGFFSTIFRTAFIRFFRIDELVQNTKLDVRHAIHVQNVSYSPLNNAIQMVLQHSKSGQADRKSAIQFKCNHKRVCSVSFIRLYLHVRPQ